MSERQVSETQPPPVRVSEQAGAIVAGARPGLRSRTATAGAPVTIGAATPAHPGPSRGAEVPPTAAEQAPDFATTFRRMYDLYNRYGKPAQAEVRDRLSRIVESLSKSVVRRFENVGGPKEQLPRYQRHHIYKAIAAYDALQESARDAERGGESERASSIRRELAAIDRRAVVDLQKLTTEIGRAGPSSIPASTPPAAGSPRESATAPAVQRPPGAMGEQQVSESPLEARPPPVGASEQAPDLLTTTRGLRSVRERYPRRTHPKINRALTLSLANLSAAVQARFENFGGDFGSLTQSPVRGTKADQAYRILQERARLAGNEGGGEQATAIRKALTEIDGHCAKELRKLSTEHGLTGLPSVQAPPQTAAATAPTVDWCKFHRQLIGIRKYLNRVGRGDDAKRFQECANRLDNQVRQKFDTCRASREKLSPLGSGFPSRPEQMYRILEGMARRAEAARGAGKLPRICASMQDMDTRAREELRSLTSEFGSLEKLAEEAGLTESQAPVTAGSQKAAAEFIAEPPGPSSRVMPAPAPSPGAPAPEVPPARRKAIIEQFSSDEAVLVAGFAVGSSATDALGWSPGRADRVLDHLQRLNSSAATDPAAAAALPGIDWSGIEALMGITDFVPPSRSRSPSPDM